MPCPPLLRAIASACCLACLLPAGAAHAESALRLNWPGSFGVQPAVTYDAARQRVGAGEVAIEKLPDGNVSLRSTSGFTGAARTQLHAVLEPVEDGKYLRPVWQESRSFDPDEQEMGRLELDHAAGFARCFKPDGTQVGELPLPAEDRVANITLNLLFLPLVRGEKQQVNFDLFFCGLGIRIVNFWANRAKPAAGESKQHAIEVRYGPDLGMASFIAAAVVPKLSIWFNPSEPHAWMAHRLPLYGGGPEVLVVRQGAPTRWFGDD